MSIKIKGRVITKGDVQAKAIVAKSPISFTYVDPATGIVLDKTHDLYGQSIKDKILVLPGLKGSAMQPFSLCQLVRNGIAPRGLVALDADLRLIVAAMYCEIPLMDKMESNPLETINTGSLVRVNADKGIVEVQR